MVSGTNWDPKARVLRGHAPSFAMPRPGPTSEVSTVKSAPARPIFVPLLCQQPLLHLRTEAISGSNWSQLTLKWPQFLGGRRAKKKNQSRPSCQGACTGFWKIGYRRVVLRPTALSCCTHVQMCCRYLSRVLHIYARNWDIALATIFGGCRKHRISSLARYPNL